MPQDVTLEVREIIENRVREQIARHQSINPTSDWRCIVDIQMDQECERLERMRDRFEEEEKDEIAEVIETVIEFLPEIAREIKSR